MAVSMLCSARTSATAKVPTVSMLAAMIGTPVQVLRLWRKVKGLSSATWERLFRFDRFGLISTSLKPSFRSVSTCMVHLGKIIVCLILQLWMQKDMVSRLWGVYLLIVASFNVWLYFI